MGLNKPVCQTEIDMHINSSNCTCYLFVGLCPNYLAYYQYRSLLNLSEQTESDIHNSSDSACYLFLSGSVRNIWRKLTSVYRRRPL